MSTVLAPAPRAQEDFAPLRDLVTGLGVLVEQFEAGDEAILPAVRPLLARLIARDGWLPAEFARPHPDHYQQYLLHCDSAERFSIVSFVWGPGQGTPIHDHRVWGLVGVLRGQERSEHFARRPDGSLHATGTSLLERGDIELLSPTQGDIHRVSNGLADAPSISIHIYGGNIGAVARATYDLAGREKRFISGYANARLPNLWKRSESL
ncbi:cysteine dioxygenase family protein [Novosphingobium rosa]|uniref:cysteine dioxygenase family protein n=1 Tax=Novosphingobium rosa TaxID=76978 RepID=UPI000AE96706|nr:cysteine dioxygenase [Novosphingobium rosa]